MLKINLSVQKRETEIDNLYFDFIVLSKLGTYLGMKILDKYHLRTYLLTFRDI